MTAHTGMGPKNHYFKFKIRLSFKENKYKIQINYIDHRAIWTAASNKCSCVNDILIEKCGTSRCIGKQEWMIQKHNANNKLLITVESLKKSINQKRI